MYDYNREVREYLGTDYMILSPNVEIFRDSQGELLKETYVVSVLSAVAPMVNACKIRVNEEEATRNALAFVKEHYSSRRHCEELVDIVERALLFAKNK